MMHYLRIKQFHTRKMLLGFTSKYLQQQPSKQLKSLIAGFMPINSDMIFFKQRSLISNLDENNKLTVSLPQYCNFSSYFKRV